MTLRYEVVTRARTGQERVHAYGSEEALRPRDILRLQGRDWLVVSVEDGEPARAIAKPARYRLRLHHPDGRDELGAFRRYRPDGPRLGHAFTTIEDGLPVSWEAVDESRHESGPRSLVGLASPVRQ